MSLSKAIQFRFLAAQLTKEEFHQFVDSNINIVLTALFNQIRNGSTNEQPETENINNIISNIILSRKKKPKQITTQNIKLNQLPKRSIGEIASFLDQSDNISFSKTNRFIYLGVNPALMSLSQINNINYNGCNAIIPPTQLTEFEFEIKKLSDYGNLKVSIDNFVYNVNGSTLICGECDFSFTKSLICKRGGGNNLCSTSWYYYISQWYNGIPHEIGLAQFSSFLDNLKYCKNAGAKITFGVDAKYLAMTGEKWNINKKLKTINRFDVVLFTLPRIHEEYWSQIRYNEENYALLLEILRSICNCLSENGEIHILLLKGQFCNWKLKTILNQLNLQLAFWSELDKKTLNFYFNGYIPRDSYGNAIKIEDKFHFCSFKMKTIKQMKQ